MTAAGQEAEAFLSERPGQSEAHEGPERAARFRILTINGRRRAFALEPIFWSILEDAAEEKSMRLGEFVSSLLADASRSNHSALLRVKAAEWAEKRREGMQDKGFLSIGRRIAASHATPAFLIDQTGSIAAHNTAFSELLRQGVALKEEQGRFSVQLRLGITVSEMMRVLKANPDKFLRVRFSLLFDRFEREGVLNAMFVGEEERGCFALGLVQSINEATPRR